MLFFQLVLLAGYAYAHLISKPPSTAKASLSASLIGPDSARPAAHHPAETWKPRGGENPTWHIFVLLSATLGLPYFVLSATGPLLQQWLTYAHPARSPYRLYALSNAGSLIALVSYPFFRATYHTQSPGDRLELRIGRVRSGLRLLRLEVVEGGG
jgi:hypothetical protein